MTVLSDNTEQNEVTVCHVLRPCVPSVGEDSFEFRGESWQITSSQLDVIIAQRTPLYALRSRIILWLAEFPKPFCRPCCVCLKKPYAAMLIA